MFRNSSDETQPLLDEVKIVSYSDSSVNQECVSESKAESMEIKSGALDSVEFILKKHRPMHKFLMMNGKMDGVSRLNYL